LGGNQGGDVPHFVWTTKGLALLFVGTLWIKIPLYWGGIPICAM
jgi:hypothetical protein